MKDLRSKRQEILLVLLKSRTNLKAAVFESYLPWALALYRFEFKVFNIVFEIVLNTYFKITIAK